MKSRLPGSAIKNELAAPTPCSAQRDRRCLNADGRTKLLYLSMANAKAIAKKHQNVYACPSGDGFHIGSKHRHG